MPGGLAGVETRLPLVFTEGVVRERLTLGRFVDIWATGPACAQGLYPTKGVIAVGSDADLVLFDPRSTGDLRATSLHMNSDCLPYEGWKVHGLPLTTILRGQVIVEEGQVAQRAPIGRLMPRKLQ